MAEEFGLEQGFGQRGAVDRDERRAAARAALVNEPGDDFFADAAFTRDQDFRVAARGVINLLVQRLHGSTRCLPV